MEETAQANGALLVQAKERAKNLIEGYVKNVGEQIGEEYTVEWVEIEQSEVNVILGIVLNKDFDILKI